MKVDEKLVKHVATLAHLQLSAEELSYYGSQFEKILGYIAQLDELSSKTTPFAQRERADNRERADVPEPCDLLDAVLKLAPQHIGSAFQVPRIIE